MLNQQIKVNSSFFCFLNLYIDFLLFYSIFELIIINLYLFVIRKQSFDILHILYLYAYFAQTHK